MRPKGRDRAGSGRDHPVEHGAWRYGSGQDRLLGIPRLLWMCAIVAGGSLLVATVLPEPSSFKYAPYWLAPLLYLNAFLFPPVVALRGLGRLIDSGALVHLRLASIEGRSISRLLILQPLATILAPTACALAVLLAVPDTRLALLELLPEHSRGLAMFFWVVVFSLPAYALASSAIAMTVVVLMSPRFIGSAALLVTAIPFLAGFVWLIGGGRSPSRIYERGMTVAIAMLALAVVMMLIARTKRFETKFWDLARMPDAGHGSASDG